MRLHSDQACQSSRISSLFDWSQEFPTLLLTSFWRSTAEDLFPLCAITLRITHQHMSGTKTHPLHFWVGFVCIKRDNLEDFHSTDGFFLPQELRLDSRCWNQGLSYEGWIGRFLVPSGTGQKGKFVMLTATSRSCPILIYYWISILDLALRRFWRRRSGLIRMVLPTVSGNSARGKAYALEDREEHITWLGVVCCCSSRGHAA